jgi:hypothetical protein
MTDLRETILTAMDSVHDMDTTHGDYADAIIAALTGWQDISTAPKDGLPVLLWAECDGWPGKSSRVVGAFHSGAWRICGPVMGEPSGDGKERQWLGEVVPKKWSPLPPPPEASHD